MAAGRSRACLPPCKREGSRACEGVESGTKAWLAPLPSSLLGVLSRGLGRRRPPRPETPGSPSCRTSVAAGTVFARGAARTSLSNQPPDGQKPLGQPCLLPAGYLAQPSPGPALTRRVAEVPASRCFPAARGSGSATSGAASASPPLAPQSWQPKPDAPPSTAHSQAGGEGIGAQGCARAACRRGHCWRRAPQGSSCCSALGRWEARAERRVRHGKACRGRAGCGAEAVGAHRLPSRALVHGRGVFQFCPASTRKLSIR